MNQPISHKYLTSRVFSLFFVLFLGFGVAAAATFAQKTALRSKSKTDVVFSGGQSVSDGQSGALLTWETSFEIGNLGFNVYRTGKNFSDAPLNRTLIPGSAFKLGANNPVRGNSSYSFFDREGAPDTEYEIETVLIGGQRSRFALRTSLTDEPLSASQTVQPIQNNIFAETKDDSTQTRFAVGDNLVDADKQRWVAAQPGVKFAIKNEGFYRVTRQQLADAGFDVNAPIANWQLYVNGIEQNLRITGEQNGVLSDTGFIEFFGYGLSSTYTDTRIYYLVAGGTPGKRMTYIEGRGYPNRTPTPSYPASVQCKTSVVADCNRPTFYFSSLRNGETENFFGDLIFSGYTSPIKLNTPFLDTAAATPATLDVSLQGFSIYNHNLQVSLNGTLLGTVTGNGTELMQRTFTVPAGLLVAGENSVLVTAPDSGDTILVDNIKLNYSRRYNVSENGKMLFPTVFRQAVRVDGFTSAQYRIFDVTDVHNVRLYNQEKIEDNGTFSAVVATVRPRLMYAVADSAVITPAAISANLPSNIYNTAQNKDLLIVTYKNWKAQAETLAAFRQSQGLTVAVIDVEDVYDEFSFGTNLPDGIRAFFERAAPNYALLMGDVSNDPKNYLNLGSWIPSYLPTFHRDSIYGEIVTDEVFGDFLNDSGNAGTNFVSEFPIGRLPVRTAADAQTIIDKIIGFEQNLPANPFERGALFISDDPIDYNFYQTNLNMAGRLPGGTTVQHVQRNGATSGTAGAVRTQIVNAVNQGPLLVGYAGHGSTGAWSSASILRSTEVGQLTNGTNNRYSIFFMLTCLNGAFADYSAESLSEALIKKSNGGAVAVWSSSGLTVATGQDTMGEKFYDLYRVAPAGTRLGELTKPARLHTFDPDVRASWILLGDPTTKVR